MKKALIPALLVVSAAFAPCLRSALKFPSRASRVASDLASPLCWRLWDELLAPKLAHWAQTASQDRTESGWRPSNFRVRGSDIASTLSSPLFWRLWDELLAPELARCSGSAPPTVKEPEWRRNSLACFLFQIFLSTHSTVAYAFAAAENLFLAVSILHHLVRRTYRAGIQPADEHPAIERRTQPYQYKERSS